MATTSYPFDSQTTTETQYSYLMRELQASGVSNDPSFAGAACQVTATGTAYQSKVNIGRAFVRGFMYDSTDTPTLTHANLTSGRTRIDTIVLQVDPTANTVTAMIVQGVGVTGTPSPPVLTQTDTGIYQMPIADVLLTGSGTLTVTDRRPFLGHGPGVWSNASRPATPRAFRLGYNTDKADWEFWNGTAWISFMSLYHDDSGWDNTAFSSIGNDGDYAEARVRKFGPVVTLQISCVLTTALTVNSGDAVNRKLGTLPAAYRPNSYDSCGGSFSSTGTGPSLHGFVKEDGTVWITSGAASVPAGTTITFAGTWMTS